MLTNSYQYNNNSIFSQAGIDDLQHALSTYKTCNPWATVFGRVTHPRICRMRANDAGFRRYTILVSN